MRESHPEFGSRLGFAIRAPLLVVAFMGTTSGNSCSFQSGVFATGPTNAGQLPAATPFVIVSADGQSPPARYDPNQPGPPYTMIMGGSLDASSPDTLWLTTQMGTMDASGIITTAGSLRSPLPYVQQGDSLYLTPSMAPLGVMTANGMQLLVTYPAAISHSFVLAQ